jgi:hypothetical protein
MKAMSPSLGWGFSTKTDFVWLRFEGASNVGHRMAWCLAILVSQIVWSPTVSFGACPCITFDVPQVVTFQPCTGPWGTPREEAAFFEMTIPVSVLVREGVQVREVFYRVDFPMTMVEVVDYLPRTTLESPVSGRISIEKRHEDNENLGISASASYEKLLSGNATAGVNQKESVALRYDVLPELQPVITSGTLERRSAVYFKIRPSPRATLEGERRLVLVVQAPRTWRAGYALVTCRAESTHGKASAPDSTPGRVQEVFIVALAFHEDSQAQAAARQLALADRTLRAAAYQRTTNKPRTASLPPLLPVTPWWNANPSPVPDNWFEHLMVLPPQAPLPKYVQHLPRSTQDAIQQFVEAKLQIAACALAPEVPETAETPARHEASVQVSHGREVAKSDQ